MIYHLPLRDTEDTNMVPKETNETSSLGGGIQVMGEYPTPLLYTVVYDATPTTTEYGTKQNKFSLVTINGWWLNPEVGNDIEK